MHDKLFHSPVAVTVGLGFKREIASISEMRDFLMEWAPSRRGRLYEVALKACEMGASGYITTEQTRRAFVTFADACSILWPEMDHAVHSHAVARGYGGFAA